MTAVGYTSGDPRKVDVAGDTMTGDLVLAGDPNAALEAATKQYVDNATGAGSGTYVNVTGDTMTGNLTLSGSGTNLTVDGVVGIGITPSTRKLDVDSTGQSAYIKSTAGTNGQHALTAYQAATTGDNSVALNVVSDNPQASTMYVSGPNTQRSTLKVTHTGDAGGADSSASAIGIDLLTAGTAANGLSIIPTNATTGNLIQVRNNSREDFVVKSTGRIGIGIGTGGTPFGMVDIRPYDASTRGLFIQAFSGGTDMVQLRDASSNTVVQFAADGTLTTTKNVTLSGSGANLAVGGDATISGSGTVTGNLHVAGRALGVPMPTDSGYLAWTADPASITGGFAVAASRVYLLGLAVHRSISVTSIWFGVTGAGSGATAGQNWAGLYSSAGSLLVSAGIDAAFTSTGAKQVSVSSTALTPGLYWVALVFNASGLPSLATTMANSQVRPLMNGTLSAANYRFAYNGTATTALASSITPASNTSDANTIPIWAAVS